MPEMNGIETLRKIKEQKNNTKVMLTIENDRKTIYEAIHIGADGYILKGSMGTDIIEAVRIVQKGEKYIDKSLVTMFSKI